MTSSLAVLIALPLVLAQPPAPPAGVPPFGSSPWSTVDHQAIVVNLPSLQFFCDGRSELLLRYLEASASWRVGVENSGGLDRTVAYQRDGGRITLNGYVKDDTRQTRLGFVFADDPVSPPFIAPCATKASPNAGQVAVAVCSSTMIPKRRDVRLYIGTPGLWLEAVLSDDYGKLGGLSEMLQAIEKELGEVRAAADDGDQGGAIGLATTLSGAPRLTVDDRDSQSLQVEAWVNPGEPGITELRARGAAGKTALTISHANLYSRERVGFSTDERQLFFANSIVMVRELATGWNSKHDVVFQLWFKPDAGGAERLLIEHAQVVRGWER